MHSLYVSNRVSETTGDRAYRVSAFSMGVWNGLPAADETILRGSELSRSNGRGEVRKIPRVKAAARCRGGGAD